MANIKTRYGEIIRSAKAAGARDERSGKMGSAASQEEARLAAKIRERVRLDYRTLASQKPSRQD